MRYLLACFATLAPLCNLGLSGEPAAQPSAKEIESLIAQLRSPNKPPKVDGKDAEYPAGYDSEAQKRVRTAFSRLRDLGLAAFPQLLEHVNDADYSMTGDGGATDVNRSVGSVCFYLLDAQLTPYGARSIVSEAGRDPRENPLRPDYFEAHGFFDSKSSQKWWQSHNGKSLRELQIEVLEWTIAAEDAKPGIYSKEEHAYLASILDKLRTSKEPLEPHRHIFAP